MLSVNRFRLLLFILILCPFSVWAEQTVLSLDLALEEARINNPNLAKMQARSQAMAAMPTQAGALPDPTIHFNAMNIPNDTYHLDQEPMTQLQVGISQAFSFPGKRSLKKSISELQSRAANTQVDETRLQLEKHIKITWWQLFFLDRALEIIDKNRSLLKQFINIARTKYEVGEGLQQDVLLAQLELSKLLDKQIQLQANRMEQSVRLNQLLGRAPDINNILPNTASLILPVVADHKTLLLKADSNRPLLQLYRQQLDASSQQLELSKKGYYPDFKLGAFYGNRQGENAMGDEWSDFVSLKVGLKLPLYYSSKQGKAIDQSTAEQLSQQHALLDANNKVVAQISQARIDFQKSRDQFELFQHGIIPQAQQTVASMLAGYQVNKVGFLNLVRSQITLFNYETRYWMALSKANQSLAKLVAAVGEETIYE